MENIKDKGDLHLQKFKEGLSIKDNIGLSVEKVGQISPKVAIEFTEIVREAMSAKIRSGLSLELIGSLLTNDKTAFYPKEGTVIEGIDDLIFFFLFELDDKRNAIGTFAIFSIDVNSGAISDISSSLTTFH